VCSFQLTVRFIQRKIDKPSQVVVVLKNLASETHYQLHDLELLKQELDGMPALPF
jgi:hypothetical protein